MTKHIIPTTPARRENEFKSAAIVRIANSSSIGGWSIGGWSENGKGRLVFQGPMIKGPVAYAVALPTVMDNNGGTEGEHERAAEAGLLFDVAEGDTLVINGADYTVTLSGSSPKLTATN